VTIALKARGGESSQLRARHPGLVLIFRKQSALSPDGN